jgi:NADPH-dependent curcumin reductase CurA
MRPASWIVHPKHGGEVPARRWAEGLDQLASWVEEGKLQPRETVVEGFEQLPSAFISMLSGGNMGKMIVKA